MGVSPSWSGAASSAAPRLWSASRTGGADSAAREFRGARPDPTRPRKARYYEHGGILPYVLRKLLGATDPLIAS